MPAASFSIGGGSGPFNNPMASTDAIAFPEQNKAFRAYGVFVLITTGKESSGALTNLAAFVSKDGGAWVSCAAAPGQQGTTGQVWVDLTAAECNANSVIVKFTSTLANAVDVIVPLRTLAWSSKAGRGASRMEELLRKTCEFAINQVSQSGAALTIYCDDGATVSVSGTFTPGDTVATRGALS